MLLNEVLYFVSTSSQVVYLDYFVKLLKTKGKKMVFSLCSNQNWEMQSGHISSEKPEQNYLEREYPTAKATWDSGESIFL